MTSQRDQQVDSHPASGKPTGSEAGAPLWRVRLFGALKAEGAGRVVEHFETRKVAALLACLALCPGQIHSRDGLAEALWPDEDWDVIRNRLRQALSSLRRVLEPPGIPEGSVINAKRTEISLVSTAVSTDVLEFSLLIKKADSAITHGERAAYLKEAVDLYEGDLAPLCDEGPVPDERRRLAEIHRAALCRLAESLSETGRLSEAIEASSEAVTEDPLREDAQCQLMRLYAAAGRRAEALRQYRGLEELLREELNAPPSPSTRSLYLELSGESLTDSMTAPVAVVRSARVSEPEGGAVPLDSPYYIERPVDARFHSALARGDSIVLIKGARHIGKTSLLARGLQRARSRGDSVVLSDIQKLAPEQLESAESLFKALAEMLIDQLDLDLAPAEIWNARRGWNVNFERFFRREVLERVETRLIWGMDEVDRLFGRPFADVAFGLFRSWHNERSLNPDGPWSKLTLAIAYATEAHLFIRDLNQSPFNVGTRLSMDDFARNEIEELNRRYGRPLQSAAELDRFIGLLDGHPFLIRRGFQFLASECSVIDELERQADSQAGIFSGHLRPLADTLIRDSELASIIKALLAGQPCTSLNGFFRLRSAGIVAGESLKDARIRCGLYRRHLELYFS